MTRPAGNHSISPASGYYGPNWPINSGVIPQSFSVGGWTLQNRGFIQQTFLGASITNFSMNGGFGDTSSTLSIDLVNDEHNKSDFTGAGLGDDPYHNGQYDYFSPPVVGSPVFFKFGKNFATVEEAYRKTFDDIYENNTFEDMPNPTITPYDKNNFTQLEDGSYVDLTTNTIVDLSSLLNSKYRGKNHLTFGGILQSYVQNRGPSANPAYSVQVVDPREILSNTVLILNNYTGTVYNNNNILNIYGFLEYNLSKASVDTISQTLTQKSILTKNVDHNTGVVTFTGNDRYSKPEGDITELTGVAATTAVPSPFPITGTGFARRGPQGIPYYRVRDAINAIMGYNGTLPQEYQSQGFGGCINFRGFNYLVDLSGLPALPDLYYFDFDQINLLDLCLEICDITSRALFVSLLPVIDHPACKNIYEINKYYLDLPPDDPNSQKVIAGIIRIDTIDRSRQPSYGAIKSFIDNLYSLGVYVENQDVGFELSNITTDKFIVGAQEVDMYYFSNNADRDIIEVEKQKAGVANKVDGLIADQWKLETSMIQQILPYYGTLGNNAVTIPKGFGAYQQILLDSTALNANGVGAYYVATEMELRCALISFDRWKQFLLMYSEIYMESIEQNDAEETYAIQSVAPTDAGVPPIDTTVSNNYAVSVPRSVFPSYNGNNSSNPANEFGSDGLPISPCNPPYGYPLYYKRANKIGIPEAGLVEISSRYTTIITNLAALKSPDKNNYREILNSEWSRLQDLSQSPAGLNQVEQQYFAYIDSLSRLPDDSPNVANIIGMIENNIGNMGNTFKILPKMAKSGTENAMRVYNFVKHVADECLGKKFLVKIPKSVNMFYDTIINRESTLPTGVKQYQTGPFGFKPKPISTYGSGIIYEYSSEFITKVLTDRGSPNDISVHKFQKFLNSGTVQPTGYTGQLYVNYNPISEKHEFNYEPAEAGGYFNFDLYQNTISPADMLAMSTTNYNAMPRSVVQMLVPQDLTNFMNDGGRISPYVRFDHSQFLALDNIGSDSFSQQTINASGMIPDVSESLDNIKPENNTFYSFPNPSAPTTPLPEQVAFVKCQLDSKLHMPPKFMTRSTHVFAQQVKDIGRWEKPRKIYREELCGKYVDSFPYYMAHYTPTTDASSEQVSILDFKHSYNSILSSNIIDTNFEQLDTDNVYALITLPGRIAPTTDARFKDGPAQQVNADFIKHYLTMDTVKGLEGFDLPTFSRGRPTTIIDKLTGNVPNDIIIQARLIAKKAMESLSFAGFPQQINVVMPSPVYPDLVSLSLMSHERCYGPWISSQLDSKAEVYANIGGKIEFIKDENLAPWNYDGYQLLNNAGKLQAEFSNSLLLFSERGGFVIPDIAEGVSLCRSLTQGGPLVTNITLDISSAGLKSTYKLDLYTSSFGKLQKQKQDEISKISRERQRLKDEKNALIRKGLGKSQRSVNYQTLYSQIASAPMQMAATPSSPNQIVSSVNPQSNQNWSSSSTGGTFGSVGDSTSTGGPITRNSTQTTVNMQNPEALANTASMFPDRHSLAESYYNSAGATMGDLYAPASKEYHDGMAYIPDTQLRARQSFYEKDPDNPESDLTIYGVA